MPTASLESALPTAVSTTSMLAPQEIHAPKPSDLRARTELTPAEKRALHHKERKAKRKARKMAKRDEKLRNLVLADEPNQVVPPSSKPRASA